MFIVAQFLLISVCHSFSFHYFFDYTIYCLISRSPMKSQNLQMVIQDAPVGGKGKHQPYSIQIDLSRAPHGKINNQNSHQVRGSDHNHHEQEKINSKIKDYESFLMDRQVEIERPQLIKEGLLTSYKLYKIKTKKRDSDLYDTIVGRRFNDFEFLHHEIVDNYGGFVLPKLPQKNFLANLNMETQEFADIRTKELQKYLQKLMNHSKVRYSNELRHFLFDEEFDFSFNKGEFSQQNTALDGLKNLTNSVYDITKSVYSRIMGKKDRKYEFSKNAEQEVQLKLFEREVEELIKVTKQISNIINQSSEEFTLIHQLSILSNRSHLSSIALEQKYIIAYRDLTQQFQEIASFIENCRDAITRTKSLRAQIEDLQDQQAAIELKQRENPRNRQLDIIRSKIQKGNTKCQKWITSLKKQLSVYTTQGKTLMQHFVRKFTELKGEIYSMVEPQF